MLSLPAELLLIVLEHLDTKQLEQLLGIRQLSGLSKRILLQRRLQESPDLLKIYKALKLSHKSDLDIVSSMKDHLHLVLGKQPSIIAKTKNPRYHCTRTECQRLGIQQDCVSKQYYRWVCQSWSLRRKIAKLYPLVSLTFPFTKEELLYNHIIIETNLVNTRSSLSPPKRLKRGYESEWSPTLEYSLEHGKRWTFNDSIFCEWQPKRTINLIE